jgi:carbonic anhydrase/acetyltransferase-like protein (isoleucine patch superfamily)
MDHVIHTASRGLGLLRARLLFRDCKLGSHVHADGRVHVVAKGDVRIGDRVQFVAGIVPASIVCDEGGELLVGDSCLFNYGATIRATRSIRIGARCMIASFVSIRDYDGDRVAPVVIGDDVWIAHGALIEPGVTIGAGSVISAGSVVCKDVPPKTIAIGNPAITMPIAAMRPAS